MEGKINLHGHHLCVGQPPSADVLLLKEKEREREKKNYFYVY
jgi:hypothetical protein